MSDSTRRELLASLAALSALAWPLRARASATFDISLCELLIPGGDGDLQIGLKVLADEINGHTSLRVDSKIHTVAPEDADLFLRPLVFWAGRSAFTPLGTDARRNLGAWLAAGGVLVCDDRSGQEASGFVQSIEREFKSILPGREFRPLPPKHAVHRSFYLVDSGGGRRQLRPYMSGIALGDTTPVLLSRNDIFGALESGTLGISEVPGWRGDALALAINLVEYAVTSNYKLDAVHVETLLDRLRREGGRWP